MHFLVIGKDGSDPEAPARRTAAREDHLTRAQAQKESGELLFAVAMKTEAGQMRGSIMVYDAPDRSTLDQWLAAEPYVQGGVWQEVEIQNAGVPPFFLPQD